MSLPTQSPVTQATDHLKIWTTVAVAKVSAWGLEDWNEVASIVALFCGAAASLSIAWWHIFKREKPARKTDDD